MLPLPPGDQWVVVRAIAYSGHPDWRNMLRRFSAKLPARKLMIDKYLNGQLAAPLPVSARAACIDLGLSQEQGHRQGAAQGLCASSQARSCSTPTGATISPPAMPGPISRIIEMLPWSLEVDSVDKLTLGSMAKYTLASNASRDPEPLVTRSGGARAHLKETAKVLAQVIDAADTVDTAKLREGGVGSDRGAAPQRSCLPA